MKYGNKPTVLLAMYPYCFVNSCILTQQMREHRCACVVILSGFQYDPYSDFLTGHIYICVTFDVALFEVLLFMEYKAARGPSFKARFGH